MRVAPLAAALLFPLVFASAPVLAADAAEITFWESVRDSRDAAELRAYLERYPNGDFAVIARRRLAALESGARPARVAAPVARIAPAPSEPPLMMGSWDMPKAGDKWAYRWREPKRVDGAKEHSLDVTVKSVSTSDVVDQYSVDGATPPTESKHERGSHFIAQGASLFTPYPPLLVNVRPGSSVGRVRFVDPVCVGGRVTCDAKGRAYASETVTVPAGTFKANKVVVEQSWQAAFAGAGAARGGRTITVWYAPEVKRAVKYVSRATYGGAPMETDFEVELLSYELK